MTAAPSARGRLRWATIVTTLALGVLLAGCGETLAAGAKRHDQGATLTVFAAASLTDAFTELGQRFEGRTGARVRISFAGSSTLATQILRGAPAEIYASANPEQMGRIDHDGLVAYGPKVFAHNRMVVVVPDENPAGINALSDLTKPGVRLVLTAEEVPAAEYAARVLRDAESRYGDRFRRNVLDNLVSREADVRAAVNRVALGDADATLAYSSDVTPDIRKRVDVIEIPSDLNVVATYPIAVLNQADNKELARRWISFVRSGAGQRVLKQWGLQPVSG